MLCDAEKPNHVTGILFIFRSKNYNKRHQLNWSDRGYPVHKNPNLLLYSQLIINFSFLNGTKNG